MSYNFHLNELEKTVCPRLRLHNSPEVLNNFEKNLGKELREKDKIVKQNKAKVVKENQTFKKKFIKDTKQEEKKDSRFKALADKNVEEGICTTRDLNRILLCLDAFDEPVGIMDFKDFSKISGSILSDGLKFLANHKIIKEINEHGRYFYQKNTI